MATTEFLCTTIKFIALLVTAIFKDLVCSLANGVHTYINDTYCGLLGFLARSFITARITSIQLFIINASKKFFAFFS